MKCKCIEQVNAQLREHNTELDLVNIMDHGPPMRISVALKVATRKVHSGTRTPAKTLLAAFCPFCGRNLQDKPKAALRKKAKAKS